jgi:hypothetical protein
LSALDLALDFIEDNDLRKPDRIDYINYLLGYFVFSGAEISESKKNRLVDWYDSADFTNKNNTERRTMFTALINMSNEL